MKRSFLCTTAALGLLIGFFFPLSAVATKMEQQGTVLSSISADEPQEQLSLQELLAAYVANHREIQTMMIQLHQQQLSHESTMVSQGIKLNLSTGNFSMGSSQIRGEPSISVSMPKLNGTYVEATFPLQFDLNKDSSSVASSGETASGSGLQGTSISIGTEIIGNSGKSNQLSILKANRSLQEAQRKIQEQALAVEKEFYSKIKELYSSYGNLLSSKDSVYTKELDLAVLQAQGYSPTSTRYRTKEMEVLSTQRNVDKQQRKFQREMELFAQKCGLQSNQLSMENLSLPVELLASTGILEQLPLEGVERYTAMESAQWNLTTTQLEMEANSPVTLSAEAGYTYKNQNLGATQADTVQAALVLQGFGGRLSSGVSVPLEGEEKTPSAQISLSWSPNDMKTQSLQKSQRELSLQLAQIKILDAEEKYLQAAEDALLTWEDLLWNRQVAFEELQLYQQLAQDTTNLYNRGMTTETEFNQATTNRDKAQIQCQIVDLELLLHYIGTRQLFVQEVQ
jgi:hypothetical protein